jgi:hypothetical protein
MGQVVAGMVRPEVMVFEGTRHLRGDVLVEGAPDRHVQYLGAPADGKNWQALRQSPASQCQLHCVPRLVYLAALFVNGLAVVSRMHIYATGQKQAIEPFIDSTQSPLF